MRWLGLGHRESEGLALAPAGSGLVWAGDGAADAAGCLPQGQGQGAGRLSTGGRGGCGLLPEWVWPALPTSTLQEQQYTNVCFWYIPPCLRACEDEGERGRRLNKVAPL